MHVNLHKGSDPNLLRTVRLRPYRKGCGPTFTLRTWDAGTRGNGAFGGRTYLRYELCQHENGQTSILFAGSDFGCSPMHAIDSDDTIASLLGFLTLRPGDTDREYFADYTEAQLDFASSHAESLSAEVYTRFGER